MSVETMRVLFPISAQRSAETSLNDPLKLEGVIFDQYGKAFAIISKKIVKDGDQIADNKVKEIRSDSVVLLTSQGTELILTTS